MPELVEMMSCGPDVVPLTAAAGAADETVAAMAGMVVKAVAARPAAVMLTTLEIFRLVSCTASCSMRIPPVS